MAEAHFREIQEAYQILNDDKKRASYDHERWLSGRFSKFVPAFSPDYLLQEIQKLNSHINSIDVYRMNKQLLSEYLVFLLKDEKLGVINRKGSEEFSEEFIPEILKTVSYLPAYYTLQIYPRLRFIEAQSEATKALVEKAAQASSRQQLWQNMYPWLVVLFTVIVCIGMYLFSKK